MTERESTNHLQTESGHNSHLRASNKHRLAETEIERERERTTKKGREIEREREGNKKRERDR